MQLPTLTLKQLRYLVALDNSKHFRRAAEQCGISQPSLTAQIQNLEGVLGVQLVERSRLGMSLTPAGRDVCTRARRILEEVQGIFDFTAGAQHGLVGTIRLGAKTTLGPYLLPHVVANLHKSNPDLSLYVREAPPRDLEHELAHGQHDVILAQLPVSGSDFVTQRLFREPLYLAMAIDHPLAEKPHITTQDLKGQQILSLNPQYHLHDQIRQLCAEYGAILTRDYEGTSLDALRQMVGMGMGVTFLPALYVRSELPSRAEIVVKQFADRTITRSIGLVWRKSAGRAHAYKRLADVVRKTVEVQFTDLIRDA